MTRWVPAPSQVAGHYHLTKEEQWANTPLQSPCHDGRFNPVTGAVVSGPPPRPLPAYELSIKDGKIWIGKPLGQIYGA